MKTVEEILEELKYRIEQGKENTKESFKAAMNSYGHGYDSGETFALMELKSWILEEEPDTFRINQGLRKEEE
jgi:hypothetical protein